MPDVNPLSRFTTAEKKSRWLRGAEQWFVGASRRVAVAETERQVFARAAGCSPANYVVGHELVEARRVEDLALP